MAKKQEVTLRVNAEQLRMLAKEFDAPELNELASEMESDEPDFWELPLEEREKMEKEKGFIAVEDCNGEGCLCLSEAKDPKTGIVDFLIVTPGYLSDSSLDYEDAGGLMFHLDEIDKMIKFLVDIRTTIANREVR